AADLRDDAAAGDVLVPRHAVAGAQHHVAEEALLGEERLAREPPANAERRERAPLLPLRELGGAIPPQRHAGVVLLVVVVIRLAEEREQPVEEARAADGLGGGVAEALVDVTVWRGIVEQTGNAAGHSPTFARIGFLAEQHVHVVPARQRLYVVERVGPRPCRLPVVVLIGPVGRVGFGV